ncbi:hypothetical protein [Clostridium saudiense]|uniref:hypothetical protein n=1 Tax=Clostridium saudiense TaxID=1414720 RepID=UPI000820F1F6|nr:hypothetical protein [Clostridium saudiense]SCJ83223.1 Uncharacterised protein [uncultured Clostridium sp.]
MKKNIIKILSGILVLGTMSTNAFAATDVVQSYKTTLPNLSTEINLVDKERASVTVLCSSNLNVEGGIIASKKIIVTSDVTRKDTGKSYKVDYISAKAKYYNNSGVFTGSSIDEQEYASHAGTLYDTTSSTSKGTAYGAHVYKSSGMNTVTHETKKAL